MEHSQVIPIIRNSGNSGRMVPSNMWQEPQPITVNVTNSGMESGGQTWPGKTSTMIMPGAIQPLPDINEQMRRMQEDMQRMQSQMPFFMGQPGPSPFPQMQPFPTMPTQDTQPRVDNMGFFRLTPQSHASMQGMPGMTTGPLDIPDVVVKCKDGSTKFLLKYDVSDFKSGEVKVEVNGGQLKVSGNHEEVSGNSVIKRTYHKEHPLPEGIKEDELRSVLSPEGILTIQAPVSGHVAVHAHQTPMLTHPAAPMPAAIMHTYPQPSTLPREGKRRVKFCESDP